LVVIAAASGRMWADLFGSIGILDRNDQNAVRRCHQIVQAVWVCGLVAAFLMIDRAPADLIIAGHFVLGALMTPLLMFAICWMAFHTDARVRMSRWTAAALVASVLGIVVCVAVNLYERFEKLTNEPATVSESAASAANADAGRK
jgi:hypothetical protein